jgi:D-alanyl-D-alanine dipeptidase
MAGHELRYRGLLADPRRVGVPQVRAAPLPGLGDPDTLPPYPVRPAGDGEPMRRLDGIERVVVLPAYRRSGWAGASERLYARSGVLDRLVAAAAALPQGFGIAVLDSWRPLELQRELYEDAYGHGSHLPPGFVSPPSADPAAPPPHLTGGALDVTLAWQGTPLALGTAFDEFGDGAHAAAFERVPGRVRELRRLLFWTMRAREFVVLRYEWWHYEYGTRLWAALTGGQPRYRATAVMTDPTGPNTVDG